MFGHKPSMRRPSTKWQIALTATLCAASVAGCTNYDRATAKSHSVDNLPPARVTGPAESCIPIPISQSRVRDNRTIDFYSGPHRGWRNVLPQDCPGLGSERAFSYETSLSKLCSTDIIHVLSTAGGLHREGSCGLGQFTPVEFRN